MSETAIPKRIGRYEIESVLGEGAMGVVYQGMDTRLHRKVAIKTILKSALDSDSAQEYSMRFRREAQAVARLNHPNIVQVFDFAEEGEIAYIVMEFVKGRELKHFFDAHESFELKEVVHIMAELCDALHFAHEAGIVHRDIKPANVMIDHQGRVKLTDFGVARITDSDRTVSERTQAGAVVGTPSYMSPEQVQGNTLDRRTDIFSAGVILYEFLTGAKPFQGTGVWTIAKKILNEHPPAPSQIRNSISPLYDAIVAKALAKAVEERYQTARSLGFALQRALDGLPEAEDPDRTLGSPAAVLAALGNPAAPKGGDATVLRTMDATIPVPRNQAVELEFWRAIKDGNDAADFDLYVQQFPSGIYAALARRKSAKLRGIATQDDETQKIQSVEQEKREMEEAQRRESEARAQLAAEKAEMEAVLAKREAEFQAREVEAQARLAEEKARQEAELAKREALLKQREAENPKKSALLPAGIAFIVAAVGFGAWQMLKPPDENAQRVVELTRLLDESKQREAELRQSRQREAELSKELEQMKVSVAEAQKSGDTARLKELAAQVAQREADMKKQAELTRQREADAERRRAEIARLQGEQGKKTTPAKPVEPVKPVEPTSPVDTKATPPKAVADSVRTPDSGKSADPIRVVTAPPTPNVTAPDAPLSSEAMLQRAIALEVEGKNVEAAKMFRQVIRAGNGVPAGQAAKRLGDLYQKGGGGVSRDYAEALRYYEIARSNGVEVPTVKPR